MSRRSHKASSPRSALDEGPRSGQAGAMVDAGAGAPGAANALSRRELLSRAGRMGFSALGLYVVMDMCGGGTVLVSPTATPSSGSVTLDQVQVQWFLTGAAAKDTTAAQLAALAQGYANHVLAITAGEQQHLTNNIQIVSQVSKPLGPLMQTALLQGGVNTDQLQSDLKKYGQLTDLQQIVAAQHDLEGKYAGALSSAYVRAGIDQASTMSTLAQQIAPLVTDPNTIHLYVDPRLLACAWRGSFPIPLPACVTAQSFTAPYTLQAAMGLDQASEEANAKTGHLHVYDHLTFAGSSQHLASVGVNVSIDPTVTHLRVEADVDIAEAYAIAVAYSLLLPTSAVGEVSLRLKLLNGVTLLAEQRLSLAKSVGVMVSWETEFAGSGTLTLALDYHRRRAATVVNYSVVVELVGTGAAEGGETYASGDLTVKEIRTATAC